jgi:thiol-disulfide isomerase/thioredoxin
MTAGTDTTSAAPKRRRLTVIAAAAIAGLGLAAVYGIAALSGNGGDPACASALATAKRIAPLAHGEVAAVNVADTGERVPALAFKDAAGTDKTLADWHGRTVLLNLWATWCVPCRKEMPALAALQKTLGGANFEVVAVNIDTRDTDKPKAWLAQTGITGLTYYADTSARVFQELKAVGKAIGMPTSLIVDGAGCEIAAINGPADWASGDALALVKGAMGK